MIDHVRILVTVRGGGSVRCDACMEGLAAKLTAPLQIRRRACETRTARIGELAALVGSMLTNGAPETI